MLFKKTKSCVGCYAFKYGRCLLGYNICIRNNFNYTLHDIDCPRPIDKKEMKRLKNYKNASDKYKRRYPWQRN